MDTKYDLSYRKGRLKYYKKDGDLRYDYERYGLLEKCLPTILFKGNAALTTFLQIIESRIIMVLHYIDRLKKFKYISQYY